MPAELILGYNKFVMEDEEPDTDIEEDTSVIEEIEADSIRTEEMFYRINRTRNTLAYIAEHGIDTNVYMLAKDTVNWKNFFHTSYFGIENFQSNNTEYKIVAQEGLKEIGKNVWRFIKKIFEKIKNFFKGIWNFFFNREKLAKQTHAKIEKNIEIIESYERKYGKITKADDFKSVTARDYMKIVIKPVSVVEQGVTDLEELKTIELKDIITFMDQENMDKANEILDTAVKKTHDIVNKVNADREKAESVSLMHIIESNAYRKLEALSKRYISLFSTLTAKAKAFETVANFCNEWADKLSKSDDNDEKSKIYQSKLRDIGKKLQEFISYLGRIGQDATTAHKECETIVQSIAAFYVQKHNKNIVLKRQDF